MECYQSWKDFHKGWRRGEKGRPLKGNRFTDKWEIKIKKEKGTVAGKMRR